MKDKILKLGLDQGTNGVGYALLDENNNLVRKNGHTFWGVRMFDEAQTAAERGSFRKNRRRNLRRKIYRTNLLRELFTEEICKIDPSFFERLDDSFFKIEDKRHSNFHNLFIDNYTDKQFYEEYPTIYHLRYALMRENKKFDIRMVFLAINHIIKYRGHFLLQGDEFKETNNSRIIEAFDKINNAIIDTKEKFSDSEDFNEDYFEIIKGFDTQCAEFHEIIISSKSIKDKKQEMLSLFKVSKQSLVYEFVIPLLLGSNVNVSKLKPLKDEKYEDLKVSIDIENLDENINKWKSTIYKFSTMFDSIDDIKIIVDHFYLLRTLKDSQSISEAMVKRYDEHKNDLKKFKEFLRNYSSADYKNCFKKLVNDKINNYSKYIGSINVSGKKSRFEHCTRDKFYAYLKEILERIEHEDAQEEKKYFLDKINKGEFLLRQRSNQNGSFPMQLHLTELKKILSNQSKYYSFLNEKENDITTGEKIISIFKFKIPYYVGVLNKKSSYSWVTRTKEKITPWNIDKVINKQQTAISFIERMQNKCTYLKGKDDYCLPKFSLLFSEYNCLSYLNKISINGELLKPELKNEIFENVFLKNKQPTKQQIINYVRTEHDVDAKTSKNNELPEVNVNMASYIKLKEIFGAEFDNEKLEKIIRDITIFEDKEILEERLTHLYHLDKEKIRQIKGLNYKGYGRLCKRLLNDIKVVDPISGICHGTVIEIMRSTNMNLQEILYNEHYRLIDIIDEYNKKHLASDEEDHATLENFIDENISISPVIKRSIIEAYKIIEEIESILGRKIDEYYVECTRTNKADKKNSASRYDKIKELYKKCDEIALLEKKLDENKDNLRSDKIYFYFMQLGKCMYTGKSIEFDELRGEKFTNIDHIYPRALIKDDSITNRVLVKHSANETKSDEFLCYVSELKNRPFELYNLLLEKGFISKEKYRRLTQKEISKNELDEFVNRQLVITNQSVKGLINVLKLYKGVDDKKVIYAKAENVTAFRKQFDLVKSRLANNFHHAHDAYLNVIVGSVLNRYFSHCNFYSDYSKMKSEKKTLNPDKIFERDSININNTTIWNKNEAIRKIKKDLYERFDVNETVRTSKSNKILSKVTIFPVGEASIPLKSSSPLNDVSKYGGFKSYSYSKYIIVKYFDKKGNVKYNLEAIPKMFELKIDEYLKKQEYSNYEIVHDNIKTGVVLEEEGRKSYITGVTGDNFVMTNLSDKFFNYNELLTIHKIEKYNNNKKYGNEMEYREEDVIIAPARNEKNKEIILTKKEAISLIETIKKLFEKKVYSYSIIKKILSSLKKVDLLELEQKDIYELSFNLLQLLQTTSNNGVDLTKIDLSKTSGKLTLSKTLHPKMKFISESITGYHRKIIFEVK